MNKKNKKSNTVKSLKQSKKDLDINPESILTKGKRIPLNQRFPNYERNPNGGVECKSIEELKKQEGIVFDLMKSASVKLLSGQNLVGLSLPVRIFESRTLLMRVVHNWGTGPYFFNKAAKENPLERLKSVITFVVSALHINITQLKPFNPVLGETYQCTWPDGGKVYLEQISHHPPIARFLIISENYKFYGYYDFFAKLTSYVGNEILGIYKGPNILEFEDGKVEFNFPANLINGVVYGKRIYEWSGDFTVEDKANGLIANLAFTPKPSFFSSSVNPTDFLTGSIIDNGVVVAQIEGSPLENLKFNGKVEWELDYCDVFKPKESETKLKSDSTKRADLVEFNRGMNKKAAMEKELIEQEQRKDRKLRSKV